MVRTPGPTPLHVTYGPNAEPRSLSQLLLREAGRHALVNGQVAVPGGGHLSRCSSLSRHPPGCRPWGRRTAFGRSGRRARITCGRRKGGGWGGTGNYHQAPISAYTKSVYKNPRFFLRGGCPAITDPRSTGPGKDTTFPAYITAADGLTSPLKVRKAADTQSGSRYCPQHDSLTCVQATAPGHLGVA